MAPESWARGEERSWVPPPRDSYRHPLGRQHPATPAPTATGAGLGAGGGMVVQGSRGGPGAGPVVTMSPLKPVPQMETNGPLVFGAGRQRAGSEQAAG